MASKWTSSFSSLASFSTATHHVSCIYLKVHSIADVTEIANDFVSCDIPKACWSSLMLSDEVAVTLCAAALNSASPIQGMSAYTKSAKTSTMMNQKCHLEDLTWSASAVSPHDINYLDDLLRAYPAGKDSNQGQVFSRSPSGWVTRTLTWDARGWFCGYHWQI